ncbi:MAG: hypothetical protein AB1714_25305 [Acidobacteriota bacterium]
MRDAVQGDSVCARRPRIAARALPAAVAACVLGLTLASPAADTPSPPSSPVRLIFIHHSTGENWLDDSNGGLGEALRDNNYFVSDTNYGWGLDSIGDTTDIGHWWTWFRGPSSSAYLGELYAESDQHCSYSRMGTNPGGENEVIMFKSCFPNSALQGNPNAAVPTIDNNTLRGQDCYSDAHTVANAKGIYIDILEYFLSRQDKLFIVICAPPLSSGTWASNARAFNQWLVNDWLDGYPYNNVFVFDFYNVLTTNGGSANTNDLYQSGGNHHRWWNGAVQHKTDGDNDGNPNVLEYPSGDDHPSRAGNLKATAEFLPLLNVAYNRFKAAPPVGPVMNVNPQSLSPSCTSGTDAAAQSFAVSNAGIGTLAYTLTWDATWLSCDPADGTSAGEADSITVTYLTSGLADGQYTAHIYVSDPAASGSPATVTVNLTVGSGGDVTISGYVRTRSGTAVGGVKVAFSNGGGQARTNRRGYYARVVPWGWSGTATPQKAGYRFKPASAYFDNVTSDRQQNFTAKSR